MKDITKINNRLHKLQVILTDFDKKKYSNAEEVYSLLRHIKADLIEQKRSICKNTYKI